MNSRQRVAKVIHHETPDRVPIDLGGTRQTGIAVTAYHQLKQKLGINTPTRAFDVYQMLAEVERPIMERFGADCVGLQRRKVAFGIPGEDWKLWNWPGRLKMEVPGEYNPRQDEAGDWVLYDASNRPIAKMPRDGYYFDTLVKNPGAAHVDPDQLELPLMTSEDQDRYHRQAEAYYQNTDFAIIAHLGPAQELFWGMGLGDFPAWMMAMALEPDYVRALYERLVDHWIENLRLLYEAVGDRVQMLQFNDDLGTQDAPFLSVKMFRELMMPYYQRGLDWIHRHTPWKVFMHNCGSIAPLIPSLIEMGVDILNPVQITAKNMNPRVLKEEFGDRLIFWGGGCDCQSTLPFGTPEQVARQVEENIRTFAPGGGYVFAAVHNIQAGVPAENILAFFETAREVGSRIYS